MQWIHLHTVSESNERGAHTDDRLHPNANKWMKAIFKIYLALGHMNRVRGWRTSRQMSSPG